MKWFWIRLLVIKQCLCFSKLCDWKGLLNGEWEVQEHFHGDVNIRPIENNSFSFNEFAAFARCPKVYNAISVDPLLRVQLSKACVDYTKLKWTPRNCTMLSFDEAVKSMSRHSFITFTGSKWISQMYVSTLCELERSQVQVDVDLKEEFLFVADWPCDVTCHPQQNNSFRSVPSNKFYHPCGFRSQKFLQEGVAFNLRWLAHVSQRTTVLVMGMVEFYDAYLCSNRTFLQLYGEAMSFLGPILGELITSRKMRVFWVGVGPTTTLEVGNVGNHKSYAYVNEKAREILSPYGVTVVDMSGPLLGLKAFDRRVAVDSLTWW